MSGKSLKNVLHAHGCLKCQVRYEDACPTPENDATCKECQGVTVWKLLIENRLPKACCIERSRLVTKDDKKSYKLVGKKLWYICKTCSRTHPFKPVKEGRP